MMLHFPLDKHMYHTNGSLMPSLEPLLACISCSHTPLRKSRWGFALLPDALSALQAKFAVIGKVCIPTASKNSSQKISLQAVNGPPSPICPGCRVSQHTINCQPARQEIVCSKGEHPAAATAAAAQPNQCSGCPAKPATNVIGPRSPLITV